MNLPFHLGSGATLRAPGWARAFRLSTYAALALMLSLAASPAQATPAPDANSVLILDTTVVGGATSPEGVSATNAGFTVVVVNSTQWAAMSQADFGTYRAIILGDPFCGGSAAASLGPAAANAATWAAATNGNVIIIGTDPTLHAKTPVLDNGIAFAGSDPSRTGAYITLACYYHGTPALTPVPALDGFGSFTMTGVPGCFDDAHKVANHPALNGLGDAELSNWGCSVHEAFDGWPASFQVLAIALSGTVFTAGDGSVGTPYILARGEELVTLGLSLSPLLDSNPVGTPHTVTATLTDTQSGAVQVGVQLGFQVTLGPNSGAAGVCSPVTCITDSNGQVTYTYTGSGGPGQDSILGWVDNVVVNGSPDQGEAQVTAAKDWFIPETTTTTLAPTTSTTVTSTTVTTTSTTSTTLSTCGDGAVAIDEECDDGGTANGDGCDENCEVEECWDCSGGPCVSLDAVICDDGDDCTQGDTCVTGSCVGTEVLVRAACDWVVVAGDPSRRVDVKAKQPAQALGDVCGDRVQMGEDTVTAGDVVATDATNKNAIRFGATAAVAGDIVTGGGRVRGKPRGVPLPELTIDEVVGGSTLAKSVSGVYDTTGTHPQVAACDAAQDGLDSAATALSGLAATVSLGNVSVKRGASLTVGPGSTPSVIAGAVNVVEFGLLTVATDGTLTLDGGGDSATVYVIRVLDKFSLGPSSLVRLFDETKNIQCSDAVFEITKKVALASLSRVYEIEDLEPGFLEKQVRFVTRQMSSSNERQRWFYAEYTPLFITRVDFARENE